MNYNVVALLFGLALAGCSEPCDPDRRLGTNEDVACAHGSAEPGTVSVEIDNVDKRLKAIVVSVEIDNVDKRLKAIVDFAREYDSRHYTTENVTFGGTIDCTTFTSADEKTECVNMVQALTFTGEKAAYPSSRLQLLEALASAQKFEHKFSASANDIQKILRTKLKLSEFELANWLRCANILHCEYSYKQLITAASGYMENGIIEGLEDAIFWHLANLVDKLAKTDDLKELAEKLEPLGQSMKVLEQRGPSEQSINNICQNLFPNDNDQYWQNRWVKILKDVMFTGLVNQELPEALVTAIYRVQARTMTSLIAFTLNNDYFRTKEKKIQVAIEFAQKLSKGVDDKYILQKPIPFHWPKNWKPLPPCQLTAWIYKHDIDDRKIGLWARFQETFEGLAENRILYKEVHENFVAKYFAGVKNLQQCQENVRILRNKFEKVQSGTNDVTWDEFRREYLDDEDRNEQDPIFREGLQQIQKFIEQVSEYASPSSNETISWFIFVFVAIIAVVCASRQRESLVHRGSDGVDLCCNLQPQSLHVEIF